MRIKLSEHFSYRVLLRFVMPSIVMMIFTSIYGVVDGLFVSNYVGKTPFAAVNLAWPLAMMIAALGFMIGTGGSAVISNALGKGENKKANEYFSMLIAATVIGGIILTVLGMIAIRPIMSFMGAADELIEDCVLYGRILLIFETPFMLQNVFQSFFITAEKPKMGLYVTIAAGFTNIVLDFLFIGVFKWGLVGAAAATGFSQVVGGIVPLIYFVGKNDSLLHFAKFRFYGKVLLKTCTNGSSELMTNISLSLVNMLYNFQLMKIAGENGVAAYGVIMYVNFIFLAAFIGYSIGIAPVVGYNYGAENHAELKNLFKKSLIIVSISGAAMLLLSESLAMPLAKLFVGYDPLLFEITRRGFVIFSVSYLISGVNIFSSAFFTALGNGAISAAISFLRTLLFQVVSVLILPVFLGIDGIWLSVTAAECAALIVTVAFFINQRKKYHYA